MGVFSCIMATIFLLFAEPLISDQLLRIQVSEHLIGVVFAGSCLAYALAAPLVNYTPGWISKEYMTFIAFILCAVAIFLEGPSKLFGMKESQACTIIGFILLGGMEAFIFVPLMPLITEAVLNKEKKSGGLLAMESEQNPDNQDLRREFEDALNDRAASVFQAA
jgi:MFS family permease